jgi:hypothetical protein
MFVISIIFCHVLVFKPPDRKKKDNFTIKYFTSLRPKCKEGT